MIQPVLKDLIITGNPNIHGKLQFTETEDIGNDFYLSGTACIGTEDSIGEDNFDFTIMTPKELERQLRNGTQIIIGKGIFIVDKLDFEVITETINQILLKHQGETWEEVAISLKPYFSWEYTDSVRLTTVEELFEMIKEESKKDNE
ncbi:Imm8 family immunity protein [Paenibacillus sp. KACC 21273]|uniref:Imm8 family immunity protein n=1 Tax=Paenibacillus sp. KACC 21273 TaxID=3025665 RepID=UPI0023670009|nr:Imm8 family immunity protein [Paenibacillus sp. KACC 21273]WDF50966.1 Imm8 family immunity protein [Paenibacillus sp. KACC 21273]